MSSPENPWHGGPPTATSARGSSSSPTNRERAEHILTAVHDVKGRCAQEFAALLDDHPSMAFVVPPYIVDAVVWVTT